MDIKNFIANYGDYIFKYAHSITYDYHLAEDISQDCYLRIIKNLDMLSRLHPAKLKCWLSRTLKNLLIDYIRKQSLEKILQPLPKNFDQKIELKCRIDKLLKCLNQEEILLIKNKFWLGMTSKESAKILNIDDSTVRHKINNALQKLRAYYKTQNEEYEVIQNEKNTMY